MQRSGSEQKRSERIPALARWAFVLAWMGIIYYFSDQANSNQVTEEVFGVLNFGVRKAAHMTEYAILFSLLRWAVAPVQSKPGYKDVCALVLTALYAASDEWHQGWVANRSASVSDVFLDISGALVALLAARIARRR